ncbi:hypothetical protein JCM11641_006538 [Rhodosporidiobolus odoratus]
MQRALQITPRLRQTLLQIRHLSTPSPFPPPPPPPLPTSSPLSARLQPYLAQLSQRYPHTDPASLTVSFLLLHELTAIVPFLIFFAAFSSLSLGAGLVSSTLSTTSDSLQERSGWRGTLRGWLEESEDKVEKVGRRYGLFGWDKETKDQREARRQKEKKHAERGVVKVRDLAVGGKVADAVAAYLVVKTLLPLRILLSLRLSPWLANGAIGRFRQWRVRRPGTNVARPTHVPK